MVRLAKTACLMWVAAVSALRMRLRALTPALQSPRLLCELTTPCSGKQLFDRGSWYGTRCCCTQCTPGCVGLGIEACGWVGQHTVFDVGGSHIGFADAATGRHTASIDKPQAILHCEPAHLNRAVQMLVAAAICCWCGAVLLYSVAYRLGCCSCKSADLPYWAGITPAEVCS